MKPMHIYFIKYSVHNQEGVDEIHVKLNTNVSPIQLHTHELAALLAEDSKCSVDDISIDCINYLGTTSKPFTEKLLYMVLIAFSLYQLNILLHHL